MDEEENSEIIEDNGFTPPCFTVTAADEGVCALVCIHSYKFTFVHFICSVILFHYNK